MGSKELEDSEAGRTMATTTTKKLQFDDLPTDIKALIVDKACDQESTILGEYRMG